MPATSTGLKAVTHICIPTVDLDRALEFYEGRLGLEKRVDVPFGDGVMRWVEVAPASGETVIALCPPPPGSDAPVGGMQTGIILATDDVDATHVALRDAGADVDAEVSRMGDPVPPMFWMRDPEGNVLMVAENDRG